MPRKKKRRKKNPPTKHHIIPKSKGGGNESSNIAIVKRKHHECYHTIFSNLLPNQIIGHLVEHYFNGNWNWVEKALKEKDHVGESQR